jgi:signal-transduction protein with cAMP-binding, CBS, and nucleotidyltransferase domain
MARGAVRVVVTKKSGVLMGIVTTSDVLRFFNKTSRDFAIEDCINRKVVTIDASRGMLDAIKVMNEKRIGCLIVTENGLPSGIVSERDLIRVMARGRRKEFGSLRLREIASKPLISAAYGIKAREASSIMLGSKIKRLPLFMGDKLIGIVTAKDLVRAYVDNVLGSRRKREIVNIT